VEADASLAAGAERRDRADLEPEDRDRGSDGEQKRPEVDAGQARCLRGGAKARTGMVWRKIVSMTNQMARSSTTPTTAAAVMPNKAALSAAMKTAP
jgi:hypothetical protein